MLSLKIMNRVSIQIDSPSYVKVSEIGFCREHKEIQI